MTNTNFRKRALLSSVAMLLVAMLALGSATFAWFSTRTTADATGLDAATTHSSSLQISEDGTNWASSITFASGSQHDTLDPVTTADGATWYTTTASAYNVGYANAATTAALTPATSGAYTNYTTLYVRYGTTVSETTKSLKLTITAPSGGTTSLDSVRVAIVPEAYGTGNASCGTAHIYGSAIDDFNKTGIWKSDSGAAGASTSNTEVWGSQNTLGSITEGVEYKWNVYIYVEGTDAQCTDAANLIDVNDFRFDLSVS